MFAALTIIPALIGGSGNFIDGVLHEFDARGGFRFWGTKRRFRIPGRRWRARPRRPSRAQAGRGRRLGALVARASSAARGSRSASRWSVLLAPGAAGDATCAWAPATRASTRPGTTTRKAYDLIAEGFGAGHQRLVPARRRAAPQKGDKAAAAADRRRGARRQGLHLRRAAGDLARRRRWRRSPPTRGPGPQEAATTDTLKRLRDDVVPAVERETGARVEVGGFTASNEDFSRVVAGKLPLFVGVVVLLQRAAAARRVPLGDHPDQGGDHEPAVDRRRARAS